MSTMPATNRFLRAAAGADRSEAAAKPKSRIWTPIRRAGLETGLRLNLTAAVIAADLGLTEKQVTDYIEQNGLGRRGWASIKRQPSTVAKPAVMLADDIAVEVRRLRAKGWSIAGLARRFSLPAASVAFAIGEPVEQHTTARRA